MRQLVLDKANRENVFKDEEDYKHKTNIVIMINFYSAEPSLTKGRSTEVKTSFHNKTVSKV